MLRSLVSLRCVSRNVFRPFSSQAASSPRPPPLFSVDLLKTVGSVSSTQRPQQTVHQPELIDEKLSKLNSTVEVSDKAEEVAEARFRETQKLAQTDGESHKPTEPISNYPLSNGIKQRLANKNITHFFPVQAECFQPILDGKDMIVRSRTGTGKTMAFCLPIVERLLTEKRAQPGVVKVLILEPTRELARQVVDELSKIVSPSALSFAAIYGGVSYDPQIRALSSGLDIAVVTPGRAIDHLQSGALNLQSTRVLVLDEADRMLDIGFQQSLDTLLQNARPPTERQTLLFSATIPPWVEKVSRNYLNSPVTLDFIGSSALQTPKGITHHAILSPVHIDDRVAILEHLLATQCSSTGRAIVFSDTKSDVDALASHPRLRNSARPLHGDVSQGRREQTLAQFKDRTFRVLVATDVAARGIDIPDVELVIHTCFPQEAEDYIHRSGRTGRAGKPGRSVLMVSAAEQKQLKSLADRIGSRVQMLFPSSSSHSFNPDQMLQRFASAPRSRSALFEPTATNLLSKYELSGPKSDAFVKEVLAPAFALLQNKAVARSLLASAPDYVTVFLERSRPFFYADAVAAVSELFSNSGKSPTFGRIECIKNQAALDIDFASAEHIRSQLKDQYILSRDTKISIPTTLPEEFVASLMSGSSTSLFNNSSQAGSQKFKRASHSPGFGRSDRERDSGFGRSDREREPRSFGNNSRGGSEGFRSSFRDRDTSNRFDAGRARY